MLESMPAMIKPVDSAAALSETERDGLSERPGTPAPRIVEVEATPLAEARAAVELGEGEVIAWVAR